MKRTTVKISEELDAKLRHIAAQRHVTLSDVTREALEQYVNGEAPQRRFYAAGAGDSGRTDIAERFEELLNAEWTDPHDS